MAEFEILKNIFKFLDKAEDIFILFNSKGVIKDINPEGAKHLTYDRDMLIGTNISALFSGENKIKFRDEFNKVLKGNDFKGQLTLTTGKSLALITDCFVGSEVIDALKYYFIIAEDKTESLKLQEKFKKLFSSNPFPTLITRMVDGKIVDMNSAFENFIGYSRDDALGKTTVQLGLYNLGVRREFINKINQAKGSIKGTSIDVKIKNGEIRNCIFSFESVEIDGENYLMSVISDETEKLKQQQSLQMALERMRISSEAASVGSTNQPLIDKMTRIIFLLKDYKTVNGAYIFNLIENNFLCKVFKKELPETDGINFNANDILLLSQQIGVDGKYFSAKIEGLSTGLNKVLNPLSSKDYILVPVINAGSLNAVFGILLSNGENQWSEEDTKFIQTLGDIITNIFQNDTEEAQIKKNSQENEQAKMAMMNVLEDVEEEKEKSEKLAGDLVKFELAVSQASDHIIITDNEGVILYANNAVQQITGYSPSEVIGKTPGHLWGGLMNPEYYKKFWDTIKIQKKTFKGEFNNKRKNGEDYVADATVSPVLNDSGEILFYVGLERDITQLKEIDRMKNEFISIASHQLRTPLSTMKWYLELLLGGDAGKLTPTQLDFVQNLNVSNERMIDLVNALLNVSRIESGRIMIEPHISSVRGLVEGVIDEIKEKAEERSIKIKVDLAKGLPMVNMDTRLVRNALMNLMTNAIKYSPKGTKITVSVVKDKEKDSVLFSVKDQGYGIPENEKEKVFEKFYRGKNILKYDTNGNGIGLYLVKQVVKASGGDVWFDSKVNVGTTFWFNLPIKGVPKKKGEVTLES